MLPGNYTIKMTAVDGYGNQDVKTIPIRIKGTVVEGEYSWSISGEWNKEGSPYVIYGINYQKQVSADSTLKINPGVKVMFWPYSTYKYQIAVSGTIEARGEKDHRILFSSYRKPWEREKGDWMNLRIMGQKDIFKYCDIEYGGAPFSNRPAILLAEPSSGDSVKVTHCKISNSAGYGLYSDNDEAVIENNVFTFNDSFPLVIHKANGVGKTNNNFFIDNSYQVIEVGCGVVSDDAVWANQSVPYFISGSYIDIFSYNSQDPCTLTIEPGVTLQFSEESGIRYIGYTYDLKGVLIAEGTENNKITFSGVSDTSYWEKGINVLSYGGIVLKNCLIKNAGKESGHSIYLSGEKGIIDSCEVTGGKGDGIYASSSADVQIMHSKISECDSFPLVVPASVVDSIRDNTFINNGIQEICVTWGHISKDAFWQNPGIPYRILAFLDVYKSADDSCILTIEKGSILRFSQSSGLKIGTTLGKGMLKAVGTKDEPIVFTALEPSKGWYGIYFDSYASDSSILRNCEVSYGGHIYENIYIYNSSPSIDSCLIRTPGQKGIYLIGASSSEITNSTIYGNAFGIYSASSGNPRIYNCKIYGNTDYGVYNNTYNIIDADSCWWGSVTGPYDSTDGNPDYNPDGLGDKVSDYVNYRPWLCSGPYPEMYSTESGATGVNNAMKLQIVNEIVHLVWSSDGMVYYSWSPRADEIIWRTNRVGPGVWPVLDVHTDTVNVVWVKEPQEPDWQSRLYYANFIDGIFSDTFKVFAGDTDVVFHPPAFLVYGDSGYVVVESYKAVHIKGPPYLADWKVRYGSFALNNPEITEWTIIDSVNGSLDSVPETTPSVCLSGNNISLVWSGIDGEIYYKEKAPTGWTEKLNVSETPDEPSGSPSINSYGGLLSVVWKEGKEPEEIYYRVREYGGWAKKENVSNSPGSSILPFFTEGTFLVWADSLDTGWDIMMRRRELGGTWYAPVNLSNSPDTTSLCPHIAYTETQDTGYVYSVWTEGNEAPYRIKTGYWQVPKVPLIISGHISENTTWARDIYIMGDVTVDSGVTLTINPKVRVYFALSDCEESGIDRNRCELIVNGKLVAEGTETDSIYFTSARIEPERNDWYGIRFTSSDTSSLDYVSLKYAKNGISYEQNSVAMVVNSSISNNETGVSAAQSAPTIKKCNINDNSSGIYCSNCTNVIIDSCQITNDRSIGLDLKEIQPGPLGGPDSMPVSGTGITFSNCDGVTVTNNEIIDDYVGVYASGYLNGVFENNYVKDNEWHGFDIAITIGSNMQFINNTFINNAKYPVNHNMAKRYYREFAGLSLAFPSIHTGETDVLVKGNTFEGNTCGTRVSKYRSGMKGMYQRITFMDSHYPHPKVSPDIRAHL